MFGYEDLQEIEEVPQDELLDNAIIIDNDIVQKLEQGLPIKENDIIELSELKINKKCYYCLEHVQASQLKEHVKLCQEQYEKILKESSQHSGFAQTLKIEVAHQHKAKCVHCHHRYEKFPSKNMKDNVSKDSQAWKRSILKTQESITIGSKRIYRQLIFMFPREHQQIHEITCEIKEKIENDLAKFQLSQAQFKAVWNMYEKSASQNQYYRTKMLKTLGSYGYNEGDLVLISEFIEYQAPICIHFNISKSISYFVRDNQYRNLFETNKSGGTTSTQSRKQWENYLFGEFYDDCQPNQRVKYGVLNYANDKYGSKKCRKYGDSIMVLKDQVRKRCTISHNRKYAPEERVATLKYINNILRKFSKDELNALFLASRGFEIDSSELKHFKEVHIHGSILFGRDIKCIYTSKEEREKNNVSANIFQQRFGVKILAFEELEAEEVR